MPAGRPSKLTPATHQRIVDACRQGCHRSTAARLAGIHERTLYYWLAEGAEATTGKKYQLYQDVHAAETELEAELIAMVLIQAPKDWRAAIELLKRRYPERWGNSMRVTGADGGPIDIQTREQAIEDARKNIARLRAV